MLILTIAGYILATIAAVLLLWIGAAIFVWVLGITIRYWAFIVCGAVVAFLVVLNYAARAQLAPPLRLPQSPPVVYNTPSTNLHIPPVEFDKPYKGKLTVETVTIEQLMAKCVAASENSLGCAFPSFDKSSCRILLVDKARIESRGWTVELMLRHETAHCNGWPQSHEGKRPYYRSEGRL